MPDKKTKYSFKDKDQKKNLPKKEAPKKTQTQKYAEKPKSKAPSLGTGLAEKAKQSLSNRKKQIDKASK